jgi:hypothetical protein
VKISESELSFLTGLVRVNLGSTCMSNGSWRDRLILRLFFWFLLEAHCLIHITFLRGLSEFIRQYERPVPIIANLGLRERDPNLPQARFGPLSVLPTTHPESNEFAPEPCLAAHVRLDIEEQRLPI